tara:strand:- start:1159 stop:1497 length:339 start_codon:yes stop_codon:yes gene_type:complete
MVLLYCIRCKKSVHIQTKHRNYLPAYGPINGRPYGFGEYQKTKCTCKYNNNERLEEVFQDNLIQDSDNITRQLTEQLKTLNQVKKLLLRNIKISNKNDQTKTIKQNINFSNK